MLLVVVWIFLLLILLLTMIFQGWLLILQIKIFTFILYKIYHTDLYLAFWWVGIQVIMFIEWEELLELAEGAWLWVSLHRFDAYFVTRKCLCTNLRGSYFWCRLSKVYTTFWQTKYFFFFWCSFFLTEWCRSRSWNRGCYW